MCLFQVVRGHVGDNPMSADKHKRLELEYILTGVNMGTRSIITHLRWFGTCSEQGSMLFI